MIPKKPKKPSVAKLKKKADASFSKYVRYRDSIYNAETEQWEGNCISCGVTKPTKEAQAGHFVSRAKNILRYDEMNVNLQCLTAESNLHMYGNYKRSIADVIIGDAVLAFNEDDFKRTVATVINVDSFVPEKLYEIELEDGSTFFATADHRVVANGKWVYIKDMLHDVSTYDILEL